MFFPDLPELTLTVLFGDSHAQVQTVTLIPGDGIGPEISAAVMKIFDAAKVSAGKTSGMIICRELSLGIWSV